MKQWILGNEYDFTDSKSVKSLMDNMDACKGANSLRQIAYGLLNTVIALESEAKKQTDELPTKYYCLSCVAPEGGFSVFLEYKHTSLNVPSNRLLVKEAIRKGILDANQEDEINKVEEISKEDYEEGVNA